LHTDDDDWDLVPSVDLDIPIDEELLNRAAKIKVRAQNKHISPHDVLELQSLLKEMERRTEISGVDKWYVPGTPFGIDKLPKHKAIFDSTKDYREVLILGGNRTSKTTTGCYLSTVTATGLYPDWWDGVVYPGPVNNYSVGKSAQTVLQTLQECLMGPSGQWGTGLIPKHLIEKTVHKSGVPGAIREVHVRHVPSGGISTITFMSADQKAHAFFGLKGHIMHVDEPTDEDVYNEILVRTMTTNGRVIHTITPKKGLTRMLANFLSDCHLLAGTKKIKGLEQAKALMDIEAEAKRQDSE